jgi:hypothetical protein
MSISRAQIFFGNWKQEIYSFSSRIMKLIRVYNICRNKLFRSISYINIKTRKVTRLQRTEKFTTIYFIIIYYRNKLI